MEEDVEAIATPGVEADDDAARLKVQSLLAEMAKMDTLETQLKGMLRPETTDAPLRGPVPPRPNPVASCEPPSATVASAARPPRQSTLSAENAARLAALLTEETEEERVAKTALRHVQTSTLRMVMGNDARTSARPPSTGPTAADALPRVAAEMLAQARVDFEPDVSTIAESVAQMEKELRLLTLKRDAKAQEVEIRRLEAEIASLQ